MKSNKDNRRHYAGGSCNRVYRCSWIRVNRCTGKNNVKVIAVVRKDSKRAYRIKESDMIKKLNVTLADLISCLSLCKRQGLSRMCSIILGGMEHLVTAAMTCIYRI